jgi:hypothetical protein
MSNCVLIGDFNWPCCFKIKLLLAGCWSSAERLNEVDFDWCIEQTLFFGEDRKPLNMILDGGDLYMVIDRLRTLLVSKVI